MTFSKKLKLLLLAGFFGVMGIEVTSDPASVGSFSIVTPAEARVGRPLTPVSVAGVARRTARRCAAGVYNC